MAAKIMLCLTIFFMSKIVSIFSAQIKYEIQNMGYCPEPSYQDIDNILRNFKFTAVNRTAKSMEWDLFLEHPIDETVEGSIEMEKWSNGRWIKMPFLPYVADPCNMILKAYSEQWVQLMVKLKVKHPDECPLPAGNYTLRNFVFNGAHQVDTIIPMIGKFKFRVFLREVKTKKMVCCLEGITEQTKVL